MLDPVYLQGPVDALLPKGERRPSRSVLESQLEGTDVGASDQGIPELGDGAVLLQVRVLRSGMEVLLVDERLGLAGSLFTERLLIARCVLVGHGEEIPILDLLARL